MTSYLSELNFSSRVLGNDAAWELCKHEVIQTIRSHASVPCYEDGTLYDNIIPVYLDGNYVSAAEVYKIQSLRFVDLTEFDAKIGGFATLECLKKALKRAGFRFRPLEQYSGYRVRFKWMEALK